MTSAMTYLAKIGLQLPLFLHSLAATSASNGSSVPANGSSGSFTARAADSYDSPGGGGGGPDLFPAGFMDSVLVTAGSSSPLMQVVLFLYRQVGARLGLDPSVLLTLLGFLWALSKIGSQIWDHVWDAVDRHFMCAMYVSEYDHIYSELLKWLSLQQSIRTSRYLMAQTVWRSAWEEEEEEIETALFLTDGNDGEGERIYLNFSNQAAKIGPRYVPAIGLTTFWHGGTYFRVHRRRETLIDTNGWGSGTKDVEELRLSCFGRSMEPIKRLLAEAKSAYYHDRYRKTSIYRPKPKEMRRDSNMWHQVARRPIRPMRTVVLDAQEKHSVLADVNEYLHPATPRWYASRGIPLRRGYLFHGPPGTGKTSFSFALAGVFGIDIYVISLQDVNITEEDLAALFTRLPRRCIVLLEDIDTAGLKRDEAGDSKAEKKAKKKQQAKEETKEVTEEEGGNKAVKELTNSVNGTHGEKEATHGEATIGDAKMDKVKDGESNEEAGKDEAKVGGEVKKGECEEGKDEEEVGKTEKCSKERTKGEESKEEKSCNKRNKATTTASDEQADDGDGDGGSERSSDSDSSDDEATEPPRSSYARRKGSKAKGSKKSISLSGLLNAIDGVASHEGRVLIMTTNKPETLDEALIRPGRVDVQVGFVNASASQAEELFYRMYETSRPPAAKQQIHGQQSAAQENGGAGKDGGEKAEKTLAGFQDRPGEIAASEAELRSIAKEFGRRMPDEKLSPAEIQGFLLKRKLCPRKALEDVGGWIEATMKQKEANSKVSTVQ